MEEERIELEMDGKTVGIGIFSLIENAQVTSATGEVILFKNIAQARFYAEKVKKLTNPLNYDLNIIIGDNNTIDFDHFDYIDGTYQLYAIDKRTGQNQIYVIKPVEKYQVDKIGYIVFNNNERIEDPEKGAMTACENFTKVRQAANRLVKFPNRDYALKSIGRYYNNMLLYVKNTSGIINIVYNSQLMNINQNRKNNNLRAFRFDKSMDKYNTLYFFIQKEYHEPDYFRSTEVCQKALEEIVKELKKDNPEIELKYIELHIPIEIDNDIIIKKRKENEDDQSNKS